MRIARENFIAREVVSGTPKALQNYTLRGLVQVLYSDYKESAGEMNYNIVYKGR